MSKVALLMIKRGTLDAQKRRYHFVICRMWHFAVKQMVQKTASDIAP